MMRCHLDREITDPDRLARLDDCVALNLRTFQKDTVATLVVPDIPGPISTEDFTVHATALAVGHD